MSEVATKMTGYVIIVAESTNLKVAQYIAHSVIHVVNKILGLSIAETVTRITLMKINLFRNRHNGRNKVREACEVISQQQISDDFEGLKFCSLLYLLSSLGT